MDKNFKFPFYAKASLLILGIFALISMLYIGKVILLPLIFALIIAIVLHPAVNFLRRFKINRLLAIIITLLVTILVITAFGSFLISQISRFTDTWPKMVLILTDYLNEIVAWASTNFDISPQKIHAWIDKTRSEFLNTSGAAIGNTLVNIGNVLVILLLIPVYVFMILYYHPLLIDFSRKVFGADHQIEVNSIITKTKTVIQQYLTGLFFEFIIVAVLNTAALFILGIEYAILLGVIGALLNMIPYLGGIVAVALPMIVALITKDSAIYPLYVLAAYYFIQLVDNNYIVPKIVASKVKINALVSIIVVLAFGALWGIPGMFLSIPITAIIKLIFDHIKSLKPWGFLLGDTMPPLTIFKIKIKKV